MSFSATQIVAEQSRQPSTTHDDASPYAVVFLAAIAVSRVAETRRLCHWRPTSPFSVFLTPQAALFCTPVRTTDTNAKRHPKVVTTTPRLIAIPNRTPRGSPPIRWLHLKGCTMRRLARSRPQSTVRGCPAKGAHLQSAHSPKLLSSGSGVVSVNSSAIPSFGFSGFRDLNGPSVRHRRPIRELQPIDHENPKRRKPEKGRISKERQIRGRVAKSSDQKIIHRMKLSGRSAPRFDLIDRSQPASRLRGRMPGGCSDRRHCDRLNTRSAQSTQIPHIIIYGDRRESSMHLSC